MVFQFMWYNLVCTLTWNDTKIIMIIHINHDPMEIQPTHNCKWRQRASAASVWFSNTNIQTDRWRQICSDAVFGSLSTLVDSFLAALVFVVSLVHLTKNKSKKKAQMSPERIFSSLDWNTFYTKWLYITNVNVFISWIDSKYISFIT